MSQDFSNDDPRDSRDRTIDICDKTFPSVKHRFLLAEFDDDTLAAAYHLPAERLSAQDRTLVGRQMSKRELFQPSSFAQRFNRNEIAFYMRKARAELRGQMGPHDLLVLGQASVTPAPNAFHFSLKDEVDDLKYAMEAVRDGVVYMVRAHRERLAEALIEPEIDRIKSVARKQRQASRKLRLLRNRLREDHPDL